MPEHNVSLKLPAVPLQADADVVFKIKIDGMTFGTLKITKDSLLWSPSHDMPTETFEVTWTAFDEWMRVRNDLKT
jgi:hypothetical protein